MPKAIKTPKKHRALPLIVLASSSPRRIQMLRDLGLNPEIVSPNIDETPLKNEDGKSMVTRLARQKALSVANQSNPDARGRVFIAADTTVVLGKKILGKPESVHEARQMLASLSGKTHTVYTAYALVFETGDSAKPSKSPKHRAKTRKIMCRTITTRVTMRKLSREGIDRYIASGEPMDKAGSYGAQGIGAALIQSISGSYANVIGLPIAQLTRDLERVCGLGAMEWLVVRPQGTHQK